MKSVWLCPLWCLFLVLSVPDGTATTTITYTYLPAVTPRTIGVQAGDAQEEIL